MDIENLGIMVDTSKAMADLRAVDKVKQQTDLELTQTRMAARDTWYMAMRVIRESWGMLRGLLMGMGITVSQVTNAIVQSAFRIGQTMITIGTAEAVTPGMEIAAAITLTQAALVIAQAYQAEKSGKTSMEEISSTNLMLGNMSRMVGDYNY